MMMSIASQTDFARHYIFVPPGKCPNPVGCDSYSLVPDNERDCGTSKDYQEIRLTVRELTRHFFFFLGQFEILQASSTPLDYGHKSKINSSLVIG
jgi:hypothetical protein